VLRNSEELELATEINLHHIVVLGGNGCSAGHDFLRLPSCVLPLQSLISNLTPIIFTNFCRRVRVLVTTLSAQALLCRRGRTRGRTWSGWKTPLVLHELGTWDWSCERERFLAFWIVEKYTFFVLAQEVTLIVAPCKFVQASAILLVMHPLEKGERFV
jgi:hypothetical protein